jgi:hypothetical protein
MEPIRMCPRHPYDRAPFGPDAGFLRRIGMGAVHSSGCKYHALCNTYDDPYFIDMVMASMAVLMVGNTGICLGLEIEPRHNGHEVAAMCFIGRNETEDDPQ